MDRRKKASNKAAKRPRNRAPARREVEKKPSRWVTDPRLPAVGTPLEKTIRCRRTGKRITCTVIVRADGFERDGVLYKSLTDAVTTFVRTEGGGSPNTRRNGFEFFGLNTVAEKQAPSATKGKPRPTAPARPRPPSKARAARVNARTGTDDEEVVELDL
jgi:hypothetical protein